MSFAEFHLVRPYWLLAIIPAIVIIILLLKNKLNQGNWSKVCDAELLPFILQQKATHRNRWTLPATAFSSVLVIFSLAGPTWERLPSPVFRNDAALVIALDLSRSMDATDIKPSRLSRARFKIADILKKRKDGQTALLVYAGDAFTVTPLTEDTETINSQLPALITEIMPSQGSNTVLALEKAIELLKQSGLQSGEILLVTDGVDYGKSIDMAVSISPYHLSILGVGTAEGAPIKIAQGGFLKDQQGNIVVPKLNSSELSQLASKANGLFQPISGNDSDIDALLNQFDNPSEKQAEGNNNLLIDQWDEKGPWLLLLALPLAALSFRKGLLSLALLVLLPFPENSYALEWNDLWQTQNQQAQTAFKQDNFQQASEKFDNPQWKAAAQYKAGQFEQSIETLQNDETASGLYNKGNALAQAGKLTEAIDAYDKSLKTNPKNEDAKHNKEQVEKQLEQQQQNQQQGDKNQQPEQDDSQQKDKQQQNSDSQNDESSEQGEQQEPEQDDAENQSEKDSNVQEPAEDMQEGQKAEEDTKQQTPEASEYDETEQANEQWLKRIPDDPAGLLKRKFKYQYGQRGGKNNTKQAW